MLRDQDVILKNLDDQMRMKTIVSTVHHLSVLAFLGVLHQQKMSMLQRPGSESCDRWCPAEKVKVGPQEEVTP